MSWYYTAEEDNYLREHCQSETMYQMAKKLNRPRSSIAYHLRTILKLEVPDAVRIKNKLLRKPAANLKQSPAPRLRKRKEKRKVEKKALFVSKAKKPAFVKKYISVTKMNLAANMAGLKPLRIDSKTTLYLKPGADVQAILKHYQKKVS